MKTFLFKHTSALKWVDKQKFFFLTCGKTKLELIKILFN